MEEHIITNYATSQEIMGEQILYTDYATPQEIMNGELYFGGKFYFSKISRNDSLGNIKKYIIWFYKPFTPLKI